MPLRNFNPKLTDEAQEAISEAFDAMSDWHAEMASTSEKNSKKVIAKMAAAARAQGWPDEIVGAIGAQMQGISKMQLEMMDRIVDAWKEQIKSPNPMANFPLAMMSKLQAWPGLPSQVTWPTTESFSQLSANPTQFWMQMGEQWQKNWAQAMTFWANSGKAK